MVSGARYVIQEYYEGRLLFCSEPTPLFPLIKFKFKPVNLEELLKQFGTKVECLISKSSMPVPTDTDMQHLPLKYYPSVPTEDEDVALEQDIDSNEEDMDMQIIDEKFEFEEYYQKE